MAFNDLMNIGSLVSCIAILLGFITLIIVIVNCCRYATLSKVRRTLIIMFYIFALTNATIIIIDDFTR